MFPYIRGVGDCKSHIKKNKKKFKGMSYLETEQANADPSDQQQVLFPPLHYFDQAAIAINAFLD